MKIVVLLCASLVGLTAAGQYAETGTTGATHPLARPLVASPTGSRLGPWHQARVTSYATSEPLTGCRREGVCVTASGELLNDSKYTMAGNGLKFGTIVELWKWDGRRMHRCRGRVNDRTGSAYRFELSYALSRCVGAPYDPLILGRWLSWSTVLSWRIP